MQDKVIDKVPQLKCQTKEVSVLIIMIWTWINTLLVEPT
jgi:hypothetical protein